MTIVSVPPFRIGCWNDGRATLLRSRLPALRLALPLRAIQKQWRDSAIRDFDTLRERELKKLDRLERESWNSWELSKKPAQTATINVNGDTQRTQKKVEDQTGDPRYLDQIQKCIASRRALLGLDAPAKIAPTSPDGEEAYYSHVMAKLMELAEGSKDGPEVIDGTVLDQMLLESENNGDSKQNESDAA